MICKRCQKQCRNLYDITKKIEVIESNSRCINSDFKMIDLCENCIRLIFENHRDKMISYLEVISYFDDMKNQLKDDLKLMIKDENEFTDYEIISMKINWIKEIKQKLKEMVL